MPKFDVSITISVVIAICAILSPICTSLINNHHCYKMNRTEMDYVMKNKSIHYKRKVYENYLRSAGKCVTYADAEALRKYGESYMLALIYFPEEFQSILISINKSILNERWHDASIELDQLAPMLRDTIRLL